MKFRIIINHCHHHSFLSRHTKYPKWNSYNSNYVILYQNVFIYTSCTNILIINSNLHVLCYCSSLLPQACGPLRTAVFKPLSSHQRSPSFSLHLNQCGTHRMRKSYIHGWQVLCCTDTRENNNECIYSAHFHPTQSVFMPLRLWHLCGLCRLKRHPVCVLLCQLSFIVPHAYTQPHINTHKKKQNLIS